MIALDYVPPADALILRMKAGRHYAEGDLLGNLLAEAIRHDGRGLPPGTVLLPVPASRAALRARGFNPAAEIARALGRDLGLPVHHDWLARTRQQAQQHTLGRLERREAAQGLYACAPAVRGTHLGIVDDVMTTGSTLHEIALALKAAGAASVTALVAARTPHPPMTKRSRGRIFARQGRIFADNVNNDFEPFQNPMIPPTFDRFWSTLTVTHRPLLEHHG
ncbi:ComF family protein [Pigmentiphaga litoralis]|uniref:ComF family protein n=1 Tax=Pigmentiphaga litoralis TaxID=516702 RepID=UPI003B427EF6